MPLYISKESPAFNELIKAIEDISAYENEEYSFINQFNHLRQILRIRIPIRESKNDCYNLVKISSNNKSLTVESICNVPD
jgi:hypothetical protein